MYVCLHVCMDTGRYLRSVISSTRIQKVLKKRSRYKIYTNLILDWPPIAFVAFPVVVLAVVVVVVVVADAVVVVAVVAAAVVAVAVAVAVLSHHMPSIHQHDRPSLPIFLFLARC